LLDFWHYSFRFTAPLKTAAVKSEGKQKTRLLAGFLFMAFLCGELRKMRRIFEAIVCAT
jgi:hypothetical protein